MAQPFVSEAGHWYDQDGNPRYEVLSRDGKIRPTTLRDARKLNLSPSVTTIIRCGDSPALTWYFINQALMAGASTPRDPFEGDQAWMDRVLAKSREHSETARDKGTAIHGAIERTLCGEPYDEPGPYDEHVRGALAALDGWCGLDNLYPEKSFAHPLGYGGKCDVHMSDYVADFKSKEFGKLDLPKTYENHSMQLAAYREGFNMLSAQCAIIYVSTSVPGLTHLVEIDEKELDRGWDMFVCLLKYWQLKNKYTPQTEFNMATEELFA